MKTIKNIKLSHSSFTIEYEDSSLKLDYFRQENELFVDITNLNLLKAVEVAILSSTHFFLKGSEFKLCWIVKDNQIKRAISILSLRNSSCFVEEMSIQKKVTA